MNNVFTTLVAAESLRALLQSAVPPVVIDASFDLADVDAGERDWRAGHLPGSLYLHLDRDLSGRKTGTNGRHPLPNRSAFAATLGRCGVTPGRQVIALDRQGGVYAARLWWLLRWMGHEAAAVLDGGLAAWTAAGGPLAAEVAPVTAAPPYPDRTALAAATTADEVARGIGRTRLIDARSAERFRGDVEPLDAVAGHIPGAMNRFFRSNLDDSGRFKSADTLRAEFDALLGSTPAAAVVHMCGSGVTACHNLLAMQRAGLDGAMLYAGSWSEWSAHPDRPVARG